MTEEKGRGQGWLKKLARWIVREEAAGEFKMYCPLHENPDTSRTPSASMNPERGKFNCFSRCGGYAISQVWTFIREGYTPEPKVEGKEGGNEGPRSRRKKTTSTEEGTLPTEDKLAEWHDRLMGNGRLMGDLKTKRGLNTATLTRYGLGWNGERVMIPIRSADGDLVNVRQYRMGASVAKMINWPGFGDACLYGLDALEANSVILTAGEMDKLIGRQYRLPTLTATAGEGTWFPAWSPLFMGKNVYIVYDCDEQGEKGARKVSAALRGIAARVRCVRLPLTRKGDDLTDYFVREGYGRQSFIDLMKATPDEVDKRVSRQRSQMNPETVRIGQSFNPAYTGRPMAMVATISGRSATPSMLPKKMDLDCDESWQKPKCDKCPMSLLHGGHMAHQISADDEILLKMMGKPDDVRKQELFASIDVPRTCPRLQVSPLEHWRVDELAVIPNVDDPDESGSEQILRRVFNVTEEEGLTPVNTTARITGVSTPDPKNAQVVFQSWMLEETKTSLDKFTMNEDLRAELEAAFHPNEGQDPLDKLREIADDMAANVTHIYGRPELHIAYDLVWHSVLDFRFRGTYLGKGWLELLVMGDTRTGKSEAAGRLTKHYQSGVLKSCEGATMAGLVGGAQQIGNSWVITWGTIPLQDRRLVILDEASGLADKNILEQMSAVRSSGKAQVSKIVSQETSARTRLIWISNPVDGKFINEMNNGAIDAIANLVKNPEDIARFDLAMVAAGGDVSSSVINAARPPRAEHTHTTELCAALVTWAWSRTRESVVWDRGVERFILQQAEELGGRYIADPPLIQKENVRVKLARIAVSVAARLFSHDGSGEKVLVTRAHVRAAVKFIDELYGQRWFGYADHSRKEIRAKRAAHSSSGECRRWLLDRDRVLTTLKTVINDTQFRSRDLEEFGGVDKEEAASFVGELLRMGMIRRRSKGYINMMPELIRIVRELSEED